MQAEAAQKAMAQAWRRIVEKVRQAAAHEHLRAPWACIAALTAALIFLCVATLGFPAARNLFSNRGNPSSKQLVFIWLHPVQGAADQGVPSDVPEAWRQHSRLIEDAAGFAAREQNVRSAGRTSRVLVIEAERNLFATLNVRPVLGAVPAKPAAILTDAAWQRLFRRNPAALGAQVQIGEESYRVAGVLPASFRFLSRQPAVYVVRPFIPAYPPTRLMVVARIRHGVSIDQLDRELTAIAQNVSYYFYRSQLRYSFVNAAIWTPLRIFLLAALVTAVFVIGLSRVRIRRIRRAFSRENRMITLSRTAFFCAKAGLALAFVFLAGVEWTRPESAIIFGSKDPANGPFLMWFYILGTMGVFAWCIADQRARCRVCLRLLCSPVRIGCPGCMLFQWSGTELLCIGGHGLLQVREMESSLDEEYGRWITLDESFQEFFAERK